MDVRAHPLTPDAIETLLELRAKAQAGANRQHRRLDEQYDDLPRGPLPVMTRAAEYNTQVYHLDLALAGLGYDHLAHGEEPPIIPRSVAIEALRICSSSPREHQRSHAA